jgi:hypothetical protein
MTDASGQRRSANATTATRFHALPLPVLSSRPLRELLPNLTRGGAGARPQDSPDN